MNRMDGSDRQSSMLITGALLLLMVVGVSQDSFAEDVPMQGDRVSVSRQGALAGRDSGSLGRGTEDAYAALKTGGHKVSSSRASKQSPTGIVVAAAPNTDFWIYDANVELHFDRDNDGYYYGLDLWFDADTYFDLADVYAVVYLSYEGGEWNEYASTDDFTIYGASADDDYIIETDLISGYPTGSYDLLIELFDAYDGTFVASMDPIESTALGFLPLEDSERDEPIVVREVVVHSGGGGSTGWLMLLLLTLSTIVLRQSESQRTS